jgi:hypothetical protein
MQKYRLTIMFLITLILTGGGVSVYAWSWSDYFVHCWKKDPSTGIIQCKECFLYCTAGFTKGYPPPPLKCP